MNSFRPRLPLLLLAAGVYLAGCSSVATKTDQNEAATIPPYKGGGYYKDDGPGLHPPENLADVPDAVPQWEPTLPGANNKYTVLGHTYVPLPASEPYKEKGLASWYGRKFHGKTTASGEPYDMYAMTAAHATLPLPSYAKVTNLENGKSVVVRVNDRGPFHDGRIIDLSYTAAYKLDILKGVTPVEVEAVLPETAPSSFVAQSEEEFIAPAKPVDVTQAALAKAETEAEAEKAKETAAPPASIYLQLAAFGNPGKADDLLNRAAAILSRDIPGVMRLEAGGLYKIQAGPFATPDAADQAAEQVHVVLGLKPFRIAGESRAAAGEPPKADDGTSVQVTPNPGPGLYLQLAAVSTPEAAQALSARVRSRYGAGLPGIANVRAGNLVKVQAGPFVDAAAADQVALAYQQDFGTKPYRVNH